MSFQPLKKILERKYKKSPVFKGVTAALVCEEFNKLVKLKWGPVVGKKCEAKFLKDKTLTVASLSSVLAQEIKLHEEEFLRELNNKFGPQTVTRIQFWS